ncbi:MAG: ComEA family DNA-binding protein [Candidatus Marinimicrobia bacterium]|nr:ComEA family DNA-binding protein [Candidatus Neomarinimicrobiota bacterium]
MLNLTRQERLVIQFLALFFVVGSAIHLIRGKTGPDDTLKISENFGEARDFKARAETVDSIYFTGQQLQETEVILPQAFPVPQKINLNSATLEELMRLPKVGEVTAQRIIDYRTAHNGFTNIDELVNVKGVGEKTLERIKNEVSIE